MISTNSELLRITKEILEYSLTKEPVLTNDLRGLSRVQLVVKAVYNMILELSADSLCMIEQKRYISSAVLLRCLFEYFMELLFLAEDPENVKLRDLVAQEKQLKMLNVVENSKDPTVAKLKNDNRHESWKKELKDVTNGNHQNNSLWDISNEMGYDSMYDMCYRTLSLVVHPHIVNYNNRYFNVDSTANKLEYNPAPQLEGEEANRRLVLLSNILINSTVCIHKVLPDSNTHAIEEHLKEFDEEIGNIKEVREFYDKN